jgi:hypothetical protein
MIKTRSTEILDLPLTGTIRNFVFFTILSCFLPELSTHAAQMGHALYKDPPVRPFAYYLQKDVAKMRVAVLSGVDSRAMIGRGGTDPLMGMTAAERIQQIRAFEDQNGSLQLHSSGGTTGIPQVELPTARDPNHYSWKRAGTGSQRVSQGESEGMGPQGSRHLHRADLCPEVILDVITADINSETLTFRGMENNSIGAARYGLWSSAKSGVDVTDETIDFGIDSNSSSPNNIDNDEGDIAMLETGDSVYFHPDGETLPGGVNPLTGADGRYFIWVDPSSTWPTDLKLKLHATLAGAMVDNPTTRIDLTDPPTATFGFEMYTSLKSGDAVILSATPGNSVPGGLVPTPMTRVSDGYVNALGVPAPNYFWVRTKGEAVFEYFVSVTHSLTGAPTMAFHKTKADATASPPANIIDLTSAGSGFKVWEWRNEGPYKSMQGDNEIFGDYWIDPATFIYNNDWPADKSPNWTWQHNSQHPDANNTANPPVRFVWRNYSISSGNYPPHVVKQEWNPNPLFPCNPAAPVFGCGTPGWWQDSAGTPYWRDSNIQNPSVNYPTWVNTREFNDRTMDPNNNPEGITLSTTVPGIASRYWLRQPASPEFQKYRDADKNMTKLYYWKFYENRLPR